ncbi:MAG TPA: maleylpyruvate isomerase N-terminal domain-containing protein, partial [Trebonia sp.]
MAALRPSDGLLGQVAAYTRETVSPVTRYDLSAPTPCSQWDLKALLLHLNTSLGALIELLKDRGPDPDPDSDPDPVGRSVRAAERRRSAAGLLAGDDVGVLLATAVCHRTERLVRV